MSHHIYQTKAFVIDSHTQGEANKTLILFTEELGFVHAIAQGVRLQKSKLKASIQNLTYSKVCLVKGREMWRLTSAEKLISLFDRRIALPLRKLIALVLRFAHRMSPGEGKLKEVFEIISTLCALIFDKNTERVLTDNVELVYILSQYKIMNALGYGSDEKNVPSVLLGARWDIELIQESKKYEHFMRAYVENAIRESHL